MTSLATCDHIASSLHNLEFEMQGLHFSLPPSAYIFSMFDASYPGCYVGVSYMDDGTILGDTFMRNFITSFDYKTGVISLAANPAAPSGVQISGQHVRSSSDNGLNGWIIFGLIMGVIAIFLIAAWLYIRCMIRKNR